MSDDDFEDDADIEEVDAEDLEEEALDEDALDDDFDADDADDDDVIADDELEVDPLVEGAPVVVVEGATEAVATDEEDDDVVLAVSGDRRAVDLVKAHPVGDTRLLGVVLLLLALRDWRHPPAPPFSLDDQHLLEEIAGRAAFREGVQKARPVLLEPMMKVEVVTPEEYVGGIIGDLTSRRGQVRGQESRGNAVVINAMVPLANMFGYVNTLRSMSQGRATFTMQFDHYEQVPQAVAPEVQAKFA